MTRLREFATALAGGAMLLAVCSTAMAIDIGSRNSGLGVSADVGRGGVSVGATVGDRGRGINADASVGVGRGSVADVDATASIGGSGGVNAGVGATVGGSSTADVDVDVGIGGGFGLNPGGSGGPDGPSAPSGPTARNPTNPGVTPTRPGVNTPRPGRVPGLVAGMSNKDIIKYRKLCMQAKGAGGFDDPAIAQLCRLLQTASR